MNTRNEAVQKYLVEGIKAARAASMPTQLESDYCAAYLAGKLADQNASQSVASQFQIEEPDRIKKWIKENRDLFLETLSNLDPKEIADLVEQPATLGAYVLMSFRAEMLYQEPADAEPCHLRDDDIRARVREAHTEAEWLGIW